MAASTLLLLFLCFLSLNIGGAQNQKLPRFRTQNGNLNILSAIDKNITLKTSGSQSYVNINGENFIGLVSEAKSAVTALKKLKESKIDAMQKSMIFLSEEIYRDGGVSQRTDLLEGLVGNLTKNLTITEQSVAGEFRTLSTRLNVLQKRLDITGGYMGENKCNRYTCKNGGTCVSSLRTFYCRCTPGWEGRRCMENINECDRFAGTDLGCQNGATCRDKPGSYECLCADGFSGLHCSLHSLSHCLSASAAELCGHGTCIPQRVAGMTFSCLCDQGWRKNEVTGACTEDVDECAALTRPACSVNPHVPCINTPGAFLCGACPTGYTGNGFYCNDIDECLKNNGACSENPKVACYNTMGSRMCGPCPPGFKGDGVTCTASRPCENNNGGCHPMARCVDNPNLGAAFVQCVCPPGYQGIGFGLEGCVRAASVLNACTPNPCDHGDCVLSNSNLFHCNCHPGYAGPICENPIMDVCLPNPCQNGGTCVPQNGTSACRCNQNFAGPQCQFRRASCGGEINQDSGLIKFSTKDEHSYADLNCLWHIIVNGSKIISGSFSTFQISRSPICTKEWVQIRDGPRPTSPSMGTFCKENAPPANFSSTGNSLVLWYKSPQHSSESSFTFQWSSKNPSCGGILAGKVRGKIKSPGYPESYPLNSDCVWRVRVRQGKRVRMISFSPVLQESSSCGDYIEIRDGNSATSRLLSKICKVSFATPVTSSGSHMYIHFHSDNTTVGADSVFEITYIEINGCGGIYTSEKGEITSPNYPGLYSGFFHCEYLIQVPINERIKVFFNDYTIVPAVGSTDGCEYKSLEIREGSNEDSPLVSELCGESNPAPFISNGNELLFIFKTDTFFSVTVFKIKYESVCGAVLTEASGMFSSPNYPDNYPNSNTCVFKIEQPLHKSIILDFLDFELEHQTNCGQDYVEIRDGDDENSQLIGRFCGLISRKPPVTFSTRNHLWIKFKSDGSTTFKGFVANYSTVDTSCGGILTNNTGEITSRNQGVVCTYVIHVQSGLVINLNWRKVWSSISNPGSHCISSTSNYIQVFDNSTGREIGRFCGGNRLPQSFTSQGNMITIVINQTVSLSDAEFDLSYKTIQQSELCGGIFSTASGAFESPNYPDNYGINLRCIYIIKVENGQQISLNFTIFHLENSSKCSFDFVEIRNGPSGTSPLIGTFCGRTRPPVILSQTNSLWIRFHTDDMVTRKGFRAIWDAASSGCGGILRSPSGHIESPNYPQPYGVNSECIWKIYTSKGNRIKLSVEDIDVEKADEKNACDDFVEFRDGDSLNDLLLAKLCNSNVSSRQINSTSNSLWIMFRTDASEAGRGFSLRYDTECSNHLTGYRGVIESPNFPGDYPHNSNCMWVISAPLGNKINVSFSHFVLGKIGANCSVNYIQLRNRRRDYNDKHDLIGKYCTSEDQPGIITSKDNILFVDFVTDISVALSGFRLEWIVHGCGGRFEAPYGTLQSPNYPKNYPENTECLWEIAVDWGKSVELVIEDMHLEYSYYCNSDYVKVFGGPDRKSPLLLQTCSMHERVQRVLSPGRYMTVYFKSGYSRNRRGFSAYFRELPTGCGGQINGKRGRFVSTSSTDQYFPQNAVCNWLVSVDANFRVSLNFIEFHVPMVGNSCERQYVAVWDGSNDKGAPLAKLCGGMNTSPIISNSSSLLVRMVTSNETKVRGFEANYQMTCGATIETSGSGFLNSIETQEKPSNPWALTNCTWIIISKNPTSRVTLSMTHLNVDELYSINKSNSCLTQFVEVHDGIGLSAPLIGKYCDSKIPPHIVSNGQALTINFVTYGYNFKRNHLIASYSVEDIACGGTLTSEEGSFAAAGYPGSYKLNSECIWILGASPGNFMKMTFSMFDLESSEGCSNDYLEIRKGTTAEDPLIGVYCGSNIPNNISISSKLWIKFKSDDQTVGAGFLAHYSLVHGGEFTGDKGTITSPMYPRLYHNSGIFWWRIIVSTKKVIRLVVKEFVVRSFYCNFEIYDGRDQNAPRLAKICKQPDTSPIFVSTGNVIFISFRSYFAGYSSLFMIEWTAEPKIPEINASTVPLGCGGANGLTNGSFEFTSPGYPGGYANNLRCEWLFEAAPGYHVALYFNALNVEQSRECTFDAVEIYSGSKLSNEWTLLEKYCHPNATQVNGVHSADRIMKVVFRSDAMRNKTGFSATAVSVCGDYLDGPSGALKIYNLTQPMLRLATTCEWNVTVREGRTIKVEISQINISNDRPGCPEEFLMLRGLVKNNSDSSTRKYFCGNLPPTGIFETIGNVLFAEFKVRKNNVKNGFTLTWQETSSNCGGRYTLTEESTINSMTIASPNHPNPPPTNTECEWIFLAPAGKRLRIDFNEPIQMIYSRLCADSYVQFFDGGTAIAASLGKFCYNNPNSILTSDNALFVRFVTTAAEPGKGFKADIRIDECGGTFTTDYNATIEVPEKNDNLAKVCVWRIFASEGSLISYTFDSLKIESTGENCSSDYVEVRETLRTGTNNNSLVAQSLTHPRYCGSAENKTWVSTRTDELILKLNSTRGIGKAAKRYFKLTFKVTQQDCGGDIIAPEGEITSPGYPGKQFRLHACQWVVTVPMGRRVKIEFIDLDLGESKSGCMQWLSISNDRLGVFPIVFYCGGSNPTEVSSSSNTVMIESLTDVKHRGFKLKFSSDLPTVCEGSIKQNTGSLSFPKVNMSSIFCEWNRIRGLSSPEGTFAITVHNITKNDQQEYPCALSIETEDLLIAQICKAISAPQIVTSPFRSTKITARQGNANNRVDFNIWYQFYECGGLLWGPMENISSPANMGMECAWSLLYDTSGQINLTFVVFNFTSDCSEQYLNIYNGPSSSQPLIGRYCKENLPPASILGQFSGLYVEYHGSKNVNNASQFLLSTMLVPTGCGGIFHDHTGLIESPRYPSLYPSNSECNWEFVVEENYKVGLKFIKRFYIEASPGCTKDYLEVFDFVDGVWKSMGRLCGREFPTPFNSSSNRMKVLFRSDNSTTGDGFVAIWSANCGGVITASEGYITSPEYPNNYGKFLSCEYKISAPKKAIMFTFLDFSLERGYQAGCLYDNVTVEKFSPDTVPIHSTQVYCGQDAPPDGVSMNSLTIKLQTDKWTGDRGFRMHYFIGDCGGDINKTRVLQPSLFVAENISEIVCDWRIFAPEKQNILLRFEEINLKRTTRCLLSSIQLFNSTWADPKAKTAEFCGNVTEDQRVFVSQGSVLTLRCFMKHTYMMQNPFSVGISFTYGESVGCGGQITLSSQRTIGSYSSRGVGGAYENMLDCRWIVKTDSGQAIKISFNSFAVKDCDQSLTNASCDCDFLEVRDGLSQFSSLLGRFCGNKLPSPITSSGNWLYVRFVSDDYESDVGFQAVVKKQTTVCGPQILTVDDTLRELTSPGYNSSLTYPANVRCRWKMRGNENRRIDIHLTQLDLETSTGCQNDSLVITENAEPSEFDQVVHTGLHVPRPIYNFMPQASANHESIYCGKGNFLDWYSRTNAVDVIFSTNNAVSGKGFKLQYQFAHCSRNFTKEFGRIHYQGRINDNFKGDCSILITTEPNRTIALYFSGLYSNKKSPLLNETSCSNFSTLRVYDGDSKSGNILAEYCGVFTPNPVFSTGPTLLISVNQKSNWYQEIFDATYTTSDKGRGCGGIARNVVGSVTSPLYPGKIATYDECVWEITVPEGSYVGIIFTAFNLGPKETCNTDHLRIYEMSSSDGREVFRTQLCGDDMPAQFTANSNSIRLKYTSSIHNAGTGWNLHFAAKKISN
ncbi:cubilin-like [Neocloeon triangulifer]|uniref:cubilin-like n=1 Tax=Neocloeon triangulifer TaxID=2078957 RepID=UPI00286EFC98|nr:cubilin-like [Neocloeon triangulifer]